MIERKSGRSGLRTSRVAHIGWAAIVALGLASCDDSAKHQTEIAKIQRQAAESAAKVERDAKEKIAAAEKQLETMRAELADAAAKAKAEADQAVSTAQQSADEQAKAAKAALDKARQAYKSEARLRLTDLNKTTAEVQAKSAKASGATRTAVNKLLQKVVELQKAAGKDIAEFDKATLETFNTVKAKVDKDLAALKAAIAAARAKVM
ncbi:MAG TPA: hypothetical protein VGJ84_04970 [Polyangiaceae bacterium]|jgi:hypothetical protein